MNQHILKWKRIFKQTRPPNTAIQLGNQLSDTYNQLLSFELPYPNKSLQTQWKGLIAPGLALYRTLLDEKTQDAKSVLGETESMFKASFFLRERKMLALLNLLPDPFSVVRCSLQTSTKNNYLPGASEVIENSNICFAVNTYRCFILDSLGLHNAAELTSLFCKTDDWLAAALPKVNWRRTTTLANGGELCDFRWCRQNPEGND